MTSITNAVASFILFTVLITLSINIYDDFQVGYNFTEGDIQTGNFTGTVVTGNVADQMKSIYVIKGIEEMTNEINKLQTGSLSGIDILGSLASIGIGALTLILGLLVFPYQITNIIVAYYAGVIPGVISGILLQIITVYIAFILLAAYLRREVL